VPCVRINVAMKKKYCNFILCWDTKWLVLKDRIKMAFRVEL